MRLRKSIAALFAAAVAPVLIATAGPAAATEEIRLDMDIALLRLESPVPGAQPIAFQARRPADDQYGLLLGWGRRCAEPGGCGQADILQELDTLIDDRMDCAYGFNAETEPCHLSAEGTGPCYGDSGGPLLAEWGGFTYLAGVTARIGYLGEDGGAPACAQA
ncbi:hypothetical protein FHR81_002849 [Actinoalloteichus hoggarensis]|uniref:Trypsin n=1 Tax=Actinoalloteichus hoggarensis TaxID=1470176 RepID=A0A221VY19_9PSEU|nr:trypsin-like serine protease [Actinoalloteichus hoggarensis]ASO18442.1 Trypsin [Actinoalloteichus hoggarensis]MBB5921809.1 hypothetical protein [Actinoalloteichus hoggarensis]